MCTTLFVAVFSLICTSIIGNYQFEEESVGNICYNCVNVPLPHLCDSITTCGPHESCYVERFVSNEGKTYYDSGCKQMNESCGYSTKRRTLPDCSQCCDTDFCNKDLCSSLPVKRINRCLKCDVVFSPNDCTKVTACSDDELCHTQESYRLGYTVYSLGCLSKSACNEELVFGRRFLESFEKCHQCCHGENCNRGLCLNGTSPSTSSITSTPQSTVKTTTPIPVLKDCFELYKHNIRVDGVYRIYRELQNENVYFDVYCDMSGGGWTVIQRHFSDLVNFTRGWADYVKGFGDLNGNFWLGLDKIHLLTNSSVDLKIEATSKNNSEFELWMLYNDFRVEGSSSSYTMYISPNVTYNNVLQATPLHDNGMFYYNGLQFATIDRPDVNNCITGGYGLVAGFWYNNCWRLRINGHYHDMSLYLSTGNTPIKSSTMKVRGT